MDEASRLTGKLTKESYERFAPLVDEQVKTKGKIRLLVEMHDFHGWTAGGLWEDIKFVYPAFTGHPSYCLASTTFDERSRIFLRQPSHPFFQALLR